MKVQENGFKIQMTLSGLFILSFLSLACEQKSAPPPLPPPPLIVAQQLTDQGQYAEAIAILEPVHAAQPTDIKVGLVLASAHLASVGIDSQNFFSIARAYSKGYQSAEVDRFLDNYRSTLSHVMAISGNSNSGIEVIRQYLILGQAVEMFLRVVESLPTLNPLQAATTEKAISILSTELPTNQRGLYLFRAVLKLILFKYRWEQGSYIAWMDLCQNRTSKLNVGISQLIGDFSDLSHDLKSAYPSHTEEIVAMVNYLREISEALDKPKDLNIKDPKTRQLLQALVLTIQARENTELKEVAACLGKI